jgi:hypothetical protein
MDLFIVKIDGLGFVRLDPPRTVLGPFDSGLTAHHQVPVLDRGRCHGPRTSTQVAFAAALASPGEARRGDVDRALFVVDADRNRALRSFRGEILDARWSPLPDCSALLFVRNAGSDQFDSDVWFVNLDGSDLS